MTIYIQRYDTENPLQRPYVLPNSHLLTYLILKYTPDT